MHLISARPRLLCLLCFLLGFATACGDGRSGDAAAPAAGSDTGATSATAAAEAALPTDPTNPCTLLRDGEVAKVLEGVGPGTRERSREEYGIAACVWSGKPGRVLAQVWTATGSSAEDEIRGLAAGVVDPFNAAAANNLRLEKLVGVGDEAFAIIESHDAQRGILGEMSLLVARKGEHVLVIYADDLARRERPAALAALQSLGRSAADRL
jgi:hypothetical protein